MTKFIKYLLGTQKTTSNKIVAVDFDDCLIKHIEYPTLKYEFMPNAKEVISRLIQQGFEFRINTARYGWFRLPVIWFAYKSGLPIKTYLFNRKVDASVYIDDKNLECKKIDWLEIEKTLLNRLRQEEQTKQI